MEAATVSSTGFANYALTDVTETPCALMATEKNGVQDAYWGDYDALIIANYSGSTAALLRYVTDSTSGTCDLGNPQHVSVAFGDAEL
jgi:hypothetical protein